MHAAATTDLPVYTCIASCVIEAVFQYKIADSVHKLQVYILLQITRRNGIICIVGLTFVSHIYTIIDKDFSSFR